MIVLDAGVLIALLDNGDAHHAAATELFSREGSPYLVHPLTMAEVLVGPARAGREHEVWRDLQAIGVEIADLGAGEAIALARLRARARLKMPDTCVLATAEHFRMPLATFDQQLAATADQMALLVE